MISNVMELYDELAILIGLIVDAFNLVVANEDYLS